MTTAVTTEKKFSIKEYKAEAPRWCANCGDYSALVGLRKFMLDEQLDPANVVNVSGIGCSGRMPHYLNTYGLHGIHGRAIPIAMGVALARPDLHLFIESGDGDSLSIGGNHLIHGINKNFNCVYVMLDNQIYGLTKNQSSPTTRSGHKTESQPGGTMLEPINPVQFALGLGCSFVASTADWLGAHLVDTLNAAYHHKGFSFIHMAQRCPKYNEEAWDHEHSNWFTFLQHENGVLADKKSGPDAGVSQHDPTDLAEAFEFAQSGHRYFGVFYKNEAKPCYDRIVHSIVANTPQKSRKNLLDTFEI